MPLDVSDWIQADTQKILESGFLQLLRQNGLSINFNAGAYLVNTPTFHPWAGGVTWVDWALANIQETPLIVEKYYNELKKEYVWWSETRHEPLGFEPQLNWMGLYYIETMVGLSFDMAEYRAHQLPSKVTFFLMEEASDREDFCHLFQKSFDYSESFKKEALPFFKDYTFHERNQHHVGYYRGHPVAIGSFYALADHGFLANLAVDPKKRGVGFGTLMLEELLASAYSLKLRHLLVLVTEEEASFFLERGFQKKRDFRLFGCEKIVQRWPKKADRFKKPIEEQKEKKSSPPPLAKEC